MSLKSQLILAGLLLCGLWGSAQVKHENAFRSPDNRHYWGNRKPHAAYWQQDVHYRIDAKVDERTRVIEASEELTYWNNSPDELSYVYFHLYQNAFVKGSYLEELYRVNGQPIRQMGKYQSQGLGTLVENLKVNGKKVKTELDNTLLKVYLPEPLQPGASVTFTMNFATFFDRGDFRRRMAVYDSWGFPHFNGVHWYPRISVYDSKKGWDTDQHLNKELYGDYGLFDVKLSFASNYIVEATGALQNEKDVLPAELRAKLDVKNFANKPWNEKPSTITPYDSARRKTWHYVANNVHDFAFTADPHYRIGETVWNGVRCIALVTEPHASKWQTASDYVAKIIRTFSEDFGMYDYPKMVAADANDGMEYPMLTLDGGADPDFRGLLVHEIGHNWFYGMVGNNETYRAALDEGFTQFLTAWGLTRIDGDTMVETPEKSKYKRRFREPKLARDRSIYNRYMADAVRANDKALNTHSNDFHSALHHENGYSNVYHKTATMLYNLQYTLGDSLFQAAMRHYVAQWKFAHPYMEDFRASIIGFAKQDLNWFFDQWLETTKTTDYGIRSVKRTKVKDEYRITLQRHGQMQMPIDFRVYARDGKTYDYHIPNTYFQKQTKAQVLPRWYGWDLLYPEYSAKVRIPSGIKTVQLDPSYRLADVDMMDNYKRPGQKLAPESMRLRFENYVQNPAGWKKYTAYARPDLWYNAVDGLKLGAHFDGSYMNYMRKLYFTVWFNTRMLAKQAYQPYEGESWWTGISPVDYTLRYETPFLRLSRDLQWGIDSRLLESFARHSAYVTYQLNGRQSFKAELTNLYRRGSSSHLYPLFPGEWSSYRKAGARTTKANAFLQMSWNQQYAYAGGGGRNIITMRAPLNYNYAFIQGEQLNMHRLGKLEIRSRLFARYGWGNDIPTESVLYLQGANPEEMMENKFNRSQGIVPAAWGGFSTAGFAEWHSGGGLNLRGYNGYYAIDQDTAGGVQFLNYKGRSGAAVNLEIDIDNYIRFRPKYLRDYLHLDVYLFGDAGIMSRAILNNTNIPALNPVNDWSKIRMDAGLGTALTIKKLGPLEKFQPFSVRFDMPFFLSAPPAASPDFVRWRWVLGVSRAF